MAREEWSVDGVVGGVERSDMVGRWDGVGGGMERIGWWVDGMVCRVGWRGWCGG